jgi:hypothetical protein
MTTAKPKRVNVIVPQTSRGHQEVPMSSIRLLAALFGGLLLVQGCSSLPAPANPASPSQRAAAAAVPTVKAEQLKELYDRGEALLDNGQKDEVRSLSKQCIEMANQAEVQQPGRAFPPYFRALCGSLAVRVTRGVFGKTFEAKSIAGQIEKDAQEAIRRDESYEDGGPLRLLGLYYLRAPRWPVGPGDVEKGTELLARARERFPQEPLNRLFYAEALVQSDPGHARRELESIGDAKLAPRFGKVKARLQGELRG